MLMLANVLILVLILVIFRHIATILIPPVEHNNQLEICLFCFFAMCFCFFAIFFCTLYVFVTSEKVEKYINWNDSHWSSSWHLNRYDGQISMNVEEAWKMGYTGKNVVVAVVDTGIEYDHPDLARNYDPKASTDVIDKDSDPYPRIYEDDEGNIRNNHGTACAGIIAAEAGNGICGVGVAYDVKLGGRFYRN